MTIFLRHDVFTTWTVYSPRYPNATCIMHNRGLRTLGTLAYRAETHDTSGTWTALGRDDSRQLARNFPSLYFSYSFIFSGDDSKFGDLNCAQRFFESSHSSDLYFPILLLLVWAPWRAPHVLAWWGLTMNMKRSEMNRRNTTQTTANLFFFTSLSPHFLTWTLLFMQSWRYGMFFQLATTETVS